MMKASKKELRLFGLVLAGFIAVGWWLFSPPVSGYWLAGIEAVLLLLVAFVPVALGPVQQVLDRVARVVSKVLNPLVLSLVFYGVFTPMGVVMRLFGYNPMRRNFDPQAESYRDTSNAGAGHDFDRPF